MNDSLSRPTVRVVWYTLASRDRRFSLFQATKTQWYGPGHAKHVVSEVRLPGRAKKASKR